MRNLAIYVMIPIITIAIMLGVTVKLNVADDLPGLVVAA